MDPLDSASAAPTHTTLQFLGGAKNVTGSKFLLTVGERRLLIDCGMFQGLKKLRELNWEPFPVDPATITDVVLTHAHMDHVGLLPRLVAQGFNGPIFATEGTVRLAEIVLRDGAKIQEQDAKDANKGGYSKHKPALPLYTMADVARTLPLLVPVPFDEDLDLEDGIVARFTRAAHIIGSASVTMWTDTTSVVFSGDLGRHDHPVLKDRGTPPGAPYALIESTYGDRVHEELGPLPHEGFADLVRRTFERGGSVLVPAFAVDRTEVLLKTIAELRRDGRIPFCPVYIDSPMANAALDVYLSMPDELRSDLEPEMFTEFPGLTLIRDAAESMALTAKAGSREPSIIVAASGMATGGRVLHHLEAMLPDKRNAVAFTGYQAVGTRGRGLVEGATKIKMHGQYVPVRAEIFQDREFSVHGDVNDLLSWLRDLEPRPRTVFVVHGEAETAAAFADRIEAEFAEMDAVVPDHGEIVTLDGVHATADSRPARARRMLSTGPASALRPGAGAGRGFGAGFGSGAAAGSDSGASADAGRWSDAGHSLDAPGRAGALVSQRLEVAAPVRPAPGTYQLLHAESPEALSALVNAMIAEGSLPYGDPGLGTVDGRTVFIQAVVGYCAD